MNRLVLQAQLLERGAMRYTPAGVPALDLKLGHESTVSEDGQARKVALEMRAVALGEITHRVGAQPLGSTATYAGFLATSRNGRGLVLHVTALD